MAAGAASAVAGEALFGAPGGVWGAIVRGAAFGITAWAVQAALVERSAPRAEDQLRLGAAVVCALPFVLTGLLAV
jgi:hypothetical protein